MQSALDQAYAAQKRGEVPIGAAIVYQNQNLCSAGNMVVELSDPTAHAEILVIRRAASILRTEFLINCDIYITLEPCAMCAQAIALSKIQRIYFGAYNSKGGAVENGARIFDHAMFHPQIYGGIRETECHKLLQDFFRNLR